MSDYDVMVIGGGSPGEHCVGALAEVAVILPRGALADSGDRLRAGEGSSSSADCVRPGGTFVAKTSNGRSTEPGDPQRLLEAL